MPTLTPIGNFLPGCQATPKHLILPEGLSYKQWEAIGAQLKFVQGAVQWWIGDWLNYGEIHYGETYAQAVETTGYEIQTLKDAKWVASRIEKSRRHDDLSFSHHREVAPLAPKQQDEILTRASKESMRSREVRQLVRSRQIKALTSSESNEWYTPAQYVEAVRQVLGRIDLDPASHPCADKLIKATRYYDLEANGLDKTWKGRVFLNPPYGDMVGEFVSKAANEYLRGNIKAAIVLVNAHSTDTNWFQVLWDGMLCFTNHRINFYRSEDMKPVEGSTHGSVFIYFGKAKQKFANTFSKFGAVVKRYDNSQSR